MADLSALILWSLGGTFPMDASARVDAGHVQIVARGRRGDRAALVTAIREPRFRHSAMILLAGYAAFG